MSSQPRLAAVAALFALTAAATANAGGELLVESLLPAARSVSVPAWADISVTFDRPIDPATVTASSFRAFGRWSGSVSGPLVLSNGDRTVTLVPSESFSSGETVMVWLSHDLRGADGSPLRDPGYSYQFWTRTRQSELFFTLVATMSTNAGKESSRPYGGIGSDLNNDGWLDITTVNEDTADLRVFMNRADGTGEYDPFLQPPSPVNIQASPNEPADFDADGNTDICVVNISTASVSILLGNGDGTFGPQQEITVGTAPRGIAVLDVDGDGDIDIASTNSNGSGSLSIMLNDGNGVFGPPSFFDGGVSNEWALAAADMNGDGLLDLVVGARNPEQIAVLLNDGDGTFTHVETQSAGGSPWMINVADVNGDGHVDVASANSGDNNASILLGDGTGQLGTAAVVFPDAFPLATDLGDIDGDGDLDWMISCFGGDWLLYLNDGAGTFTFETEFLAPDNASCALLLDIDNDRDLDVALFDEIADVVRIGRNGVIEPLADVNNDGVVNVGDLVQVITEWGPCGLDDPCLGDVDGDGVIGVLDLVAVILGLDVITR